MGDKDKPEVDLAQMVKDQAAIIALLQQQISDIHAKLPVETPAPQRGAEFPCTVYRKKYVKGQIDHPGNEAKTVGDQAALEKHLDAGWALEPFPYDADEEEMALAAPKGRKKVAA